MSLATMKAAFQRGLHARVAGWECRLRPRDVETSLAEVQDRHERFVTEFGPAGRLPNHQLAALVAYCADVTDEWPSIVAAELLHGSTDLAHDELDLEHPRVLAVTQHLDGDDR